MSSFKSLAILTFCQKVKKKCSVIKKLKIVILDHLTFPTLQLLDAIGPVAFCLCLNHGLTAVPIDLIFGMHTHVMSRSIIGYIILTF